jgi:hypothetical protein
MATENKVNSNLPMHAMPQHRYPRLRGYNIGDDREVTVHLCLGLPCCGLDLLIEHPSTMTAVELYQVAGEFAAMRERVKRLPAFCSCAVIASNKEAGVAAPR